MAKLPIQPLINAGKVAVEYAKNNPGKVKAAAFEGIEVVKKFKKDSAISEEKRHEELISNGKIPYRKMKYLQYQRNVLPNLDTFSNIKLNSYKYEIEDFIKQIEREEKEQLIANKPLNTKRKKSWKQIHVQITDKIKTKNYEEFLKAYNDPSYTSDYFEDKVIINMRSITSKDELYKFIHLYTEKNLKDIERDFF